MIFYIKKNHLDQTKYNQCIANALHSKVYAYSWYLDAVAQNWDVLVLNDYEAVMPLPWKKKHGILYSTQPYFCQQLGIFSSQEISNKTIKKFVQSIPKKFLKVALQFHAGNNIFWRKTIQKRNYILPLDKPVKTIEKNFRKDRKAALKKAAKHTLFIDKNIDKISFLNFYINNDKTYQKNKQLLPVVKNILATKNESVQYWGVKKEEKLIAVALFLKDLKRLTFLISVTSLSGKKYGAITFLIYEMIKTFSKDKLVLDFEGSMIPSIASFYKSFGAQTEAYSLFKKRWL